MLHKGNLVEIEDGFQRKVFTKYFIISSLPKGYIYSKKDRPVRDLARKEMFLVQYKTAHMFKLANVNSALCAIKVSANDIRTLTVNELEMWLEEEHLVLAAQANLDSINFLKQTIKGLEKAIIKKVKLRSRGRTLVYKLKFFRIV